MISTNIKAGTREFPGGPGVRTPCFDCRGMASIPGQGIKIPHAKRHSQEKKKKKLVPVWFPLLS